MVGITSQFEFCNVESVTTSNIVPRKVAQVSISIIVETCTGIIAYLLCWFSDIATGITVPERKQIGNYSLRELCHEKKLSVTLQPLRRFSTTVPQLSKCLNFEAVWGIKLTK